MGVRHGMELRGLCAAGPGARAADHVLGLVTRLSPERLD